MSRTVLLRNLLCFLLISFPCAFGQETNAPVQPAPSGDNSLPPITQGQRIYASHHSYFLQQPPILNELAAAGGFPDQKFIGTDYIGGSKSLQHWLVPDAVNKAKIALQTGTVDVLILTPVYLPDDGIEKFTEFGLKYNPNLRVTVQEFWLPYDQYNPHFYDPPKVPPPGVVDHNAATVEGLKEQHKKYFDEMDALVTSLNQKFGKQVIFVVPAGQAVIALREKIIAGQAPGLKSQNDLFGDKLGHPRPPLQALIAYCHYAVIYRKSPVGLPAPKVLVQMKLSPDDQSALNLLLQQLAWDAVTQHPLSGVTKG
jgi:hypothetical protein